MAITIMQPATAAVGERVEVQIVGQSFAPLIFADFDNSSQSAVSVAFSARLGETPLEDVRFIDSTTLAAVVPATLPSGTYELVVIDPRQREARLPAAFTVGSNGAHDGGLLTDSGLIADGGSSGADAASLADAASDAPNLSDAASDAGNGCPPGCSSCDLLANSCQLDCTGASCTCPPGMNCSVSCSATNPCTTDTIDCTQARNCNIQCIGTGSCPGTTNCAGARECNINCSGASACTQTVNCIGTRDSCEIQCTTLACTANPICTGNCEIN